MDINIFKVTLSTNSLNDLALIAHLNTFKSGKGIQSRTLEIKRLMMAGFQAVVEKNSQTSLPAERTRVRDDISNSSGSIGTETLPITQSNPDDISKVQRFVSATKNEANTPINSAVPFQVPDDSKGPIPSISGSTPTAKVASAISQTLVASVDSINLVANADEIENSVFSLLDQITPISK